MPAFINDGPDIPEPLLREHEQGNVVFFCGSGISIPAGLPTFKGLVDQIYKKIGTSCTEVEHSTYEKAQYDLTLHHLEQRIPGGRNTVRKEFLHILKPKYRRKGAINTHRALLQLARDREDKVRLVTTNYDGIFQRIIKTERLDAPHFSAPFLPIPKKSRWHGVTYLHGLLPKQNDNIELNRLILTSGDFGLAYLIEGWAARFVSELFRNFTVCFVGYSIDDPVLRYMMDALAADESLGEAKREAYAFADYVSENHERAFVEWKAKGVTPLLFEVSCDSKGMWDYSKLHRSIAEWAEVYRDGVQGKRMIVAQYAPNPPLLSLRNDFAVGRVLWALTDHRATQSFAELNPVPPLEWLDVLSESQYKHSHLPNFGVISNSQDKSDLQFSAIHRPSPYSLAPMMCVVDYGVRQSNWDEVMFQLARWLTRHLGNPKLILWLASRGGQLHWRFALLVRTELTRIDHLQATGQQDALDKIRISAPNAIPGKAMRVLWDLILAGRIRQGSRQSQLFEWMENVSNNGLSFAAQMEFRKMLTPYVALRPPTDGLGMSLICQ